MTKLTEHTVLARTRAQDLRSVRKLNAWGSELSDVSIVKNLPNVEVLSLSVNNIVSLRDFAHCNNLQELYLRKNSILDLSEIRHLKELSKLRYLWLADNPCAEEEHYRLTVIRNLPQLQKLDNIAILPDERESSNVQGISLDGHAVSPISAKASAVENADETHHPDDSQIIYNIDTSKAFTPLTSPVEPFPSKIQEPININRLNVEDVTCVTQCHENEQEIETSHQYISSSDCQNNCSFTKQTANLSEPYVTCESEILQEKPDLGLSERFIPIVSGCSSTVVYPTRNNTTKTERTSAFKLLPKGGRNRNANILSAVLCLIKELDLPSLEVVDTAVHCLMEELEAGQDTDV